MRSSSTFPDLEVAERVILETVQQNKKEIHKWVKAGMPGKKKPFRYKGTGEVIGVGYEPWKPRPFGTK